MGQPQALPAWANNVSAMRIKPKACLSAIKAAAHDCQQLRGEAVGWWPRLKDGAVWAMGERNTSKSEEW